MKPSGIEWIGDIPESWSTVRGKNTLNLMKRPFSSEDSVITCFRDGEVTLRINRREDGFTFADKEIGYQGIKKDDLVIHGMDGFAGAIGISDSDGKGSPVLSVCREKNDNDLQFVMYYLRMLSTQNVFIALATGIRERSCDLRWNKISDLLFPHPPLPEQQAIADYLNRKCELIDSTIEKQKTAIEKLKLYKQSVITEAVTKGLNPTVPMKPSGIEWIGDIPKGWDSNKVKLVTSKIGSGVTPRGGSEVYVQTGIIFLRSQNIYNEGLKIDDVVFISEDIDKEMENTRVYSNDLLLNITGGSIGRCCIFPKNIGSANVNQHVCIIRPIEGLIDISFLHYFFMSDCGVNSITVFQSGANREGLNFKQIANMRLPLPPLPEQQAIADYLDQKCTQIDQVIEHKQKLIEKLSNYKKSLIYECVTGKREVKTA
jgi:type I restriction enzyme S subunit